MMHLDTDKDTTYHLVGSEHNAEDGFELAGTLSDAAVATRMDTPIDNTTATATAIDNPWYLRLVAVLGILLGAYILFSAVVMTLMLPMLGDSGTAEVSLVGFCVLVTFLVGKMGFHLLVESFQYTSNRKSNGCCESLGGRFVFGVMALLLYIAVDWVLKHTLDFLLVVSIFQLGARWYASVYLADAVCKRLGKHCCSPQHNNNNNNSSAMMKSNSPTVLGQNKIEEGLVVEMGSFLEDEKEC